MFFYNKVDPKTYRTPQSPVSSGESMESSFTERELEELKRNNQDSHTIKMKQLELEQLQITFSPASKEVKNIS